MNGVRRCPEEPIDSWWRRLHRDGKRFWTKNRFDVISAVKVCQISLRWTHCSHDGSGHRSSSADSAPPSLVEGTTGQDSHKPSTETTRRVLMKVSSMLCTVGKDLWTPSTGPPSNPNQKLWWAGCKQLKTEKAGKEQRNTTWLPDPLFDDNAEFLHCLLLIANDDLSSVALPFLSGDKISCYCC